MKKFIFNILCGMMIASGANAITFDYNCYPMFSPVVRKGLLATTEAQGYSWSLIHKVVPDAALKKFYSLTPAGVEMGSGFDNARWSGLTDDLHLDCFRFDWIAGEIGVDDSACTGEKFKQRTSGHAELTIYNNYCQAKMPKRVSEMFALGGDLPSEFINMWDAEYLTKNYTPNNPSVAEKEGKDIDMFFQLNIAAEKLWQEILVCEGGDSERARLAVAEGSLSCREVGGAKDKLKELIVNTLNYFSSSQAVRTPFYDTINGKYVPGAISNDSPLVIGNYEFGGLQKYLQSMKWDGVKRNPIGEAWTGNRAREYQGEEFFKNKYSAAKAAVQQKYSEFSVVKVLDNRVQVHPLFSQIVLEILSTQFLSKDLVDDFGKIYKRKYMFDFRDIGQFKTKPEFQNLNNNISDFSLTYLERMCEPAGLWPSAGFSALLYMQRQISLALPLMGEKRFPTETIGPEHSADFLRIGYWAGDYGRAQLNCIRGKVLPDIYYKDVKSIIKHYRDMFHRHTADN